LSNNANQERERRRVLKVYTIVEKPGSPKGIWLDIGVASDNRDGSLSVKLDALPVNGAIHIREFEPRKTDSDRPSGDKNPPNRWKQGGNR
jgi:hypothetical protein